MMLDHIRAQLPRLSAAERKVAELVLAQPYSVTQAAVGAIAAHAGVSQPTVIRFARTMRCTGLPEFKQKLASSLINGVPYVHAKVCPADPAAEIAPKVIDSTVAALIKCRNDINAAHLEQALSLLSQAQRIEFYGLGNSGIVAADAQHKFFRLGMPTVAYADSHVQTMSASMLTPGSVVVALSHSGRSVETLEAVKVALNAGASVVAITASSTPLANLATVALTADTPEDPESFSPMASRIVHLALIDILAVGVALRQGPRLISRLEKASQSLLKKRLYWEP
ncbi:SIS domain-containing protein [Paludibacterium sp.]|uniref:SIS domain-containing protein n=1 Tax=Paludibacterium sp. TaxID=1917523 RepID=UPI003455DFE4